MKKYLLPENGNFYKANLHTHSDVSDGRLSLTEVKEAYKNHGYSVVAFTDHDIFIPHNDLTDENFVALNSYEISVNQKNDLLDGFQFIKVYHLNLFAKDQNLKYTPLFGKDWVGFKNSFKYMNDEMCSYSYKKEFSIEGINRLIKDANEAGFLVSYNHPVWSMQNYRDYGELKGLWGVEWYNNDCAMASYDDTITPITDLLNNGEKVFPIATDDMHFSEELFGGFVMLKAEKLDYNSVINALEKGDFYSSNGVEIYDLYVEDDKLHIKCSPAKNISVIASHRSRAHVNGDGLTEAEIDITKMLNDIRLMKEKANIDGWFFIRVQGLDGKTAYTKAYFYDDIK
ncbi:MAG: PHP domain-containing protein [Clostridia bacterium]|nr:PHP domain-containing protein [Clostridia bacterium]